MDGLGQPVLTNGNLVSTEGFVGIQSTIRDGATYAGSYLWTYGDGDSVPLVEAGVNYPVECDGTDVQPYTYATLFPNGTIQSITKAGDQTTTVRLTADGNVYNDGSTSTIGSLYVAGNISTLGTMSYATGLRVPEPDGAIGSNKYVAVTAAGCRSTSRVFFTYSYITRPGFLSAESIVDGGFTICSTSRDDDSSVQYFIVN